MTKKYSKQLADVYKLKINNYLPLSGSISIQRIIFIGYLAKLLEELSQDVLKFFYSLCTYLRYTINDNNGFDSVSFFWTLPDEVTHKICILTVARFNTGMS